MSIIAVFVVTFGKKPQQNNAQKIILPTILYPHYIAVYYFLLSELFLTFCKSFCM